ncbi:hypothetical protein [Cryobacterium arcticum]|uniref:DUF4287 domain-containing protein n=1 Tax=Cryobacterium arcticum TaxID=670052 RepID=A0A317ZTG6_9MICO|nr:hypothetical protein [Cryobacterium arcticum]PXA68439.1 hypothetical protein CTB96_17740 [Cryobacterium arcticum]
MIAHDTFSRSIRQQLATIQSPVPALSAEPVAAAQPHARRWAAEPLHSDARILENTGHGWDDWAELIEAGPGRDAGHTAIAAWVHAEHGVPGWWAQGVTVGYERIAGLRLPGQMPDGSFSVSRSRVLDLPAPLLRAALLDGNSRADLFTGLDTELRSKPASKALRYTVRRAGHPLGSLLFSADPVPDGRLRVTVTHDKLPTVDDGELWKQYWADWLAAVAAVTDPAAQAKVD